MLCQNLRVICDVINKLCKFEFSDSKLESEKLFFCVFVCRLTCCFCLYVQGFGPKNDKDRERFFEFMRNDLR